MTYRFASFERQVGGASAGINAKPDDRGRGGGRLRRGGRTAGGGRTVPDRARAGGEPDGLAALVALDPRPGDYWTLGPVLTGVSVTVAARVAAGGLEGATVAMEGFDANGPAIAAGLGQHGARLVAVSTAQGTATGPGFDPDQLAGLWSAHGPELVAELVPPDALTDPEAVFGVEADVLVTGSRSGVVDDAVAGGLGARVVVPSGPTPVTAKALAGLRRAGKVVVPDFICTAGPMFAGWPDEASSDPARAAADAIAAVLGEVMDHPDGPLLAACYRAEAFLATWCEQLPFGRPIA